MKRKRILMFGAMLLVLALVGIAIGVVSSLAQQDVKSRLVASASTPVEVVFDGMHLSISHGVRVEYEVRGHEEINAAQWRLWPFREVVTEK